MNRTTILGLLAGTILAVSGCERRETRMEEKETTTGEPATGAPAAAEPTAGEPGEEAQPVAGREEWKEELTDGNILSYAVAANQQEIDSAQLVLGKTMNPDVKDFATKMVKDHSDALKQTMDVSARIDVKPESFARVDDLKKQSTESIDKLSKLSGADLDKAFLMTTIEEHRQLLTTIDTKLLPAADSSELKDSLTSLRRVVQSHLDEAGKIDLAKSKAGGASTEPGGTQ